MFAFCDRRGVIAFSVGKCPDGMLEIARNRSAKKIKEVICANARHSYNGITFLVPGVPEAESDDEACDAVIRFRDRVNARLANARPR